MLLSMRFVVFVCGLLLVLALLGPAMADPQEQQATEQPQSARAQFRLPKLFDFSLFKRLFKKSYRSLAEELARQKVFLGRAFRAFVSAVSYKHAKCSSYLGINQMSDMTPDEIERSKISSRKLASYKRRGHHKPSSAYHREANRVPVAELDDIKAELEDMKLNNKLSPGFKEAVEELEASGRSKRATDQTSSRRQLSLDELIPDTTKVTKSDKYVYKVPSNNPEYEPIELMSQGVDDDASTVSSLSDSVIGVINNLSGVGYLKTMSQQLTSTFAGAAEEKVEEESEKKKPDVVWVDHRKSKCFLPAKNQGQCGSCYAFATIALYEWMFCMNTGKLVAFSEQYMIDCIKLVDKEDPEEDGCEGSDFDASTDLVKSFGLELDARYPYRAKAGQCPHTETTKLDHTGYIRPQETSAIDLRMEEMKKAIKETPILVGLSMGPNFRSYAGGVDDNLNCAEDDSHAMLAVGRGREDGKKYWLLRNSHSDKWGLNGYWKVSHEAMKRCLDDDVGTKVLGKFPEKHYKNPHYQGPSKKKHSIKT